MNIKSMILNIYSFLFILYGTRSSLAYTIKYYEIHDLMSSGSSLSSDAASWSIPNIDNVNKRINQLEDGTYILGGEDVLSCTSSASNCYFQRTYSGLAPHVGIQFTLLMFYFGYDWRYLDGSPSLVFDFSGTLVDGPKLEFSSDFWDDMGGPNYGWFDQKKDIGYDRIVGTVPHIGSSLIFKIWHKGSESSSRMAFGFRELSMTLIPSGTVAESMCHRIRNTDSGVTKYDKCSRSFISYQTCNSDCDVCSGSSASSCLQCKSPKVWRGYSCCPENDFQFENGTCLPTCPYPFVQVDSGYGMLCNKPCIAGQFWGWNDTCFTSCLDPLTRSTDSDLIDWCKNDCGPSDKFLFTNKTCLDNCPFPLALRFEPGVKFCWNPCNPPNLFLYPNQSCFGVCRYPLAYRNEPGVRYCFNPCPSSVNYYLYPNQTCFTTCFSPLVIEIEPIATFCFSPCETGGDFVFRDKSCRDDCPPPMVLKNDGTAQYCVTPCPGATDFLLADGTCTTSCPLPLVSKVELGTKYCENPCSSLPNSYLYPDGSCSGSCDPPLVAKLEPEATFCTAPCSPSTAFVYPNGSCSDSCDPPWESSSQAGINYCKNPCAGYVYKNGTCHLACDPPLISRSEPGINFCNHPCPEAGTFLAQNGSCLDSCPPPLVPSSDIEGQYCYQPCPGSGDFLYQNSSCLSSCDFPFVKSMNNSVKECTTPCPSNVGYFYPQDSTCRDDCKAPYAVTQIGPISVCNIGFNISKAEVEEILKVASVALTQQELTHFGVQSLGLVNPATPTLIPIGGLAPMLQHIRFINIDYPVKVMVLFSMLQTDPVSLGFDLEIPNFVDEGLPEKPLPDEFAKYEDDLHSSFLINYWPTLTSLLFFAILIIILALLKFLTQKWRKVNAVFSKLLKMLEWNLPLAFLCSSLGDISLYLCLEIRTFTFDNKVSIASLGIGIFMSILGTFICFKTLYISYDIRKAMQKNHLASIEEDEATQTKWRNYDVLYSEYEEKSFSTLSYLSIFLLRNCVYSLVIGVLSDHPLLQASIITSMSLFMFVYLFIWRPIKNILNFLQAIANEYLILVVNTCVLFLAIMDKLGSRNLTARNTAGEIILIISKLFNYLTMGLLALQFLMVFITMFKILQGFREKGLHSIPDMVKHGFSSLTTPDSEAAVSSKKDCVHSIDPEGESSTLKSLNPEDLPQNTSMQNILTQENFSLRKRAETGRNRKIRIQQQQQIDFNLPTDPVFKNMPRRRRPRPTISPHINNNPNHHLQFVSNQREVEFDLSPSKKRVQTTNNIYFNPNNYE